MNDTIKSLEQGIPVTSATAFNQQIAARNPGMEFRILTRITLHQDHVKNLQILDRTAFKEQNRYNEVLPFKHCQVELNDINILRESLQL